MTLRQSPSGQFLNEKLSDLAPVGLLSAFGAPAQSFAVGAPAQIEFQTIDLDNGGFVATPPPVPLVGFVIPVTGIYLVGANLRFSPSADNGGRYAIGNGTLLAIGETNSATDGGEAVLMASFTANDAITFTATVNDTGMAPPPRVVTEAEIWIVRIS